MEKCQNTSPFVSSAKLSDIRPRGSTYDTVGIKTSLSLCRNHGTLRRSAENSVNRNRRQGSTVRRGSVDKRLQILHLSARATYSQGSAGVYLYCVNSKALGDICDSVPIEILQYCPGRSVYYSRHSKACLPLNVFHRRPRGRTENSVNRDGRI